MGDQCHASCLVQAGARTGHGPSVQRPQPGLERQWDERALCAVSLAVVGRKRGEREREKRMDVKAITDMLETYVRPATFPVGIKMLKAGETFPPRTRTPADLGSHFATCQTINIVRRYGWSIGLAAEHHSCPLGLVALGFKPTVE